MREKRNLQKNHKSYDFGHHGEVIATKEAIIEAEFVLSKVCILHAKITNVQFKRDECGNTSLQLNCNTFSLHVRNNYEHGTVER